MPKRGNRKGRKGSQADLLKIFNAFAREALRDYPQLKGRLALYNASTQSWHSLPGCGKGKHAPTQNLVMEATSNDEGFTAFAVPTDEYALIAYHVSDRKARTMASTSDALRREILATLEHELGHLVAPAGIYSKYGDNFSECVADAFAFIRQQQKYRDVQRPLKATAWIRTHEFVLDRESLHFTLPVLTELQAMLQEYDLSRLTPSQSANLAYRLARQYACTRRQLRRLMRVFAPARRICKRRGLKAALKKCAQVMLARRRKDAALIYAVGSALLRPYLDREIELLATLVRKQDAQRLRLTGPFWDDVREKMAWRDEELARQNARDSLNREALHMQALGYFDRDPSHTINIEKYESRKNQAHLQRRREAYIARQKEKIH